MMCYVYRILNRLTMGMEGNQRTSPQCYPKLCTLDQWYCDPFKIFQTSFCSLLRSKGRCSVVTINDLSESLCSSTLSPAFGIIHFPHLFTKQYSLTCLPNANPNANFQLSNPTPQKPNPSPNHPCPPPPTRSPSTTNAPSATAS